MGIRNGNKTTTKNVKRIDKHSELPTITIDPLAYAKRQVEDFNKQYKEKASTRQISETIEGIYGFDVSEATNSIESLNSSYRRSNRQRSVFPSSQSLLKALYLATFEATK